MRIHTEKTRTPGRRLAVKLPAILAGAVLLGACGDLDLINTNAPTVEVLTGAPTTAVLARAATGIFAQTYNDIGTEIQFYALYGREGYNLLGNDPRETGEQIRGRDAIAKHLGGFYHGALEARAEKTNAIFGDGRGVLEARVVGRHTGVFAGVPATGRDVDVPLCVTYELSGGLIKQAHIYLMVNVLLAQITSA